MITEIFNNVFHSFWTWAGTTIIIATVTQGLVALGNVLIALIARR